LILEFCNKKMLPSCATDVTSISRSSVLPPEYLQASSNEHVQAVIVLVDGMFFQERKRIAQLAASARLPAVYGFREHVDAGGLISYGVNLADNFRRAANTRLDTLLLALAGMLPTVACSWLTTFCRSIAGRQEAENEPEQAG
jgi:ABC-type uncharacterized transport system substrate-binding protein